MRPSCETATASGTAGTANIRATAECWLTSTLAKTHDSSSRVTAGCGYVTASIFSQTIHPGPVKIVLSKPVSLEQLKSQGEQKAMEKIRDTICTLYEENKKA